MRWSGRIDHGAGLLSASATGRAVSDLRSEPGTTAAPRPETEGDYYQAVLEGIARIEAQAYRKLAELGAPPLINLRSVGGGARPAGFTAIRQRALGVPFLTPISAEAAVGAARLALWQGVLA